VKAHKTIEKTRGKNLTLVSISFLSLHHTKLIHQRALPRLLRFELCHQFRSRFWLRFRLGRFDRCSCNRDRLLGALLQTLELVDFREQTNRVVHIATGFDEHRQQHALFNQRELLPDEAEFQLGSNVELFQARIGDERTEIGDTRDGGSGGGGGGGR
jgi:hypothetical protein